MGFFSAIMKNVARFANDTHANHQRKKAMDIAFNNTGKQIKIAKRNHTWIDGSATYQNELNKQLRLIDQRHNRIDRFIDDL